MVGVSIDSGASRIPYFYTPLVCVSVVIDSLDVWYHNKPKTKKNVKERKKGIKKYESHTMCQT